MTAAHWASIRDPSGLLALALPCICQRHLCLVLLELAHTAVAMTRGAKLAEERLARHADALGELVRQWCFFQVSDDELRAAGRAVRAACLPAHQRASRGPHADFRGLLATAAAADFAVGGDGGIPAGTVISTLAVMLNTAGAVAAAQRARPSVTGPSIEALVRRRIPYPSTRNQEWVAFPGIVFSGEFVLRIDRGRIGDVVRRSEFQGLTGARAVAFDQAQQQAAAESEGQARDRAAASPRLERRLREIEEEAAAALRHRDTMAAMARADAERQEEARRAEARRIAEEAARVAAARARRAHAVAAQPPPTHRERLGTWWRRIAVPFFQAVFMVALIVGPAVLETGDGRDSLDGDADAAEDSPSRGGETPNETFDTAVEPEDEAPDDDDEAEEADAEEDDVGEEDDAWGEAPAPEDEPEAPRRRERAFAGARGDSDPVADFDVEASLRDDAR